jgi:hypothetical protein
VDGYSRTLSVELRGSSGLDLVVGVTGAASVTDSADPLLPGWGLRPDDHKALNEHTGGIFLDRGQ